MSYPGHQCDFLQAGLVNISSWHIISQISLILKKKKKKELIKISPSLKKKILVQAENFSAFFYNHVNFVFQVKDVFNQTEVNYLEMLQDGYQFFDKLMNRIGSNTLLPG